MKTDELFVEIWKIINTFYFKVHKNKIMIYFWNVAWANYCSRYFRADILSSSYDSWYCQWLRESGINYIDTMNSFWNLRSQDRRRRGRCNRSASKLFFSEASGSRLLGWKDVNPLVFFLPHSKNCEKSVILEETLGTHRRASLEYPFWIPWIPDDGLLMADVYIEAVHYTGH